ncbi:MAG: trpS [Chlamydiales bacterium]|jgi:tryptophanyl-tRNA synthetase|nr:trpS [Chlamydiales bacterium]
MNSELQSKSSTQKRIVVSGIKPTGSPHLGNYLGMIRPALEMSRKPQYHCYYFIADYHALTTLPNPKSFLESTYDVAATMIACGLDPEKVTFYRQSDVPEIMELSWVLACLTKKGAMNIAHAYKAAIAQNQEKGLEDLDVGINMGLYNYPILMAADVLAFQGEEVPVGKDQIQHIEIMRDIAGRFNQTYKPVLKQPKALVGATAAVLPGLDGRKMSKSYNNTIPLFVPSKKLQKLVGQIQTDSTGPDEPKDPNNSVLFTLYREFATTEQIQEMQNLFEKGISWRDAKQALFELLDFHLSPARSIYEQLLADRSKIDVILKLGAEKARIKAAYVLNEVRRAIGIS